MTESSLPARSRPFEFATTSASAATLSRLLGSSLLILVAVTFPLWTPQTEFPQVPLFRFACNWPGAVDWTALGLLVVSCGTLVLAARHVTLRRAAGAGVAAALAIQFVLNQHRLQPWAWQYAILALLVALGGEAALRRGWFWLVLSIYFWSAVSKLDATFVSEYGPALLGGLKQSLGLRGIATTWTRLVDHAGSIGLVAGELGLPFLLAWPRTRRVGLVLAVLMHAVLLLALGPFGLNHSWGVLGWNALFLVQAVILFGGGPSKAVASESEPGNVRATLADRIALIVVLMGMVLPALEPFGVCDHWLAWAVYSPRSDQSEFLVWEDESATESALVVARRRDVSGWSLSQLGVPLLPQHRFHVGLARALSRETPTAVILWHPPNRWTGRRPDPAFELVNPADLEQVSGSRWWCNTRPRQGLPTPGAAGDLRKR